MRIILIFLLFLGTAWANGDECRGNCGGSDDGGATVGDVVADASAEAAADAASESTADATGIGEATATSSPVITQQGPTSNYVRTEAVRVAPAFGTACYESMNASLLDKGFAIGSANKICQSLQIVDVWFALAAATEDPVLAAEYTDEGMKILRKTTALVNRGLAWHNVKSFFQEVGVPIGIIVLLI